MLRIYYRRRHVGNGENMMLQQLSIISSKLEKKKKVEGSHSSSKVVVARKRDQGQPIETKTTAAMHAYAGTDIKKQKSNIFIPTPGNSYIPSSNKKQKKPYLDNDAGALHANGHANDPHQIGEKIQCRDTPQIPKIFPRPGISGKMSLKDLVDLPVVEIYYNQRQLCSKKKKGSKERHC